MKNWEELIKRNPVLQESLNELSERYNALESFQDAREWDKDSQAFIDILLDLIKDWGDYRKEQESLYEQLIKEREGKPFINKLFSKRPDEDVKKSIDLIDIEIKGLESAIDMLSELMDKTPANKSEQKEIADNIKLLKKELSLKKQEVNESLRQIRANARIKATNWTGVTGGIIGKVAKYQRISARLEKEIALTPIEDVRKYIEKKAIALERDLIWIMHFKGDDQETKQSPQEETISVMRCNYCGRRVNDLDDVCKGCGAVV